MPAQILRQPICDHEHSGKSVFDHIEELPALRAALRCLDEAEKAMQNSASGSAIIKERGSVPLNDPGQFAAWHGGTALILIQALRPYIAELCGRSLSDEASRLPRRAEKCSGSCFDQIF